MVVDQHNRSVAACAHAFTFDEGKFAVGRGFAVADTEFFLQVFAGIHAAAQSAGKVGADGQFVFADRLEVIHIVESGDFVCLRRRDADIVGNKSDGFGGEPAFFGLGNTQRAHDGGTALVGGIFRQLDVDLF